MVKTPSTSSSRARNHAQSFEFSGDIFVALHLFNFVLQVNRKSRTQTRLFLVKRLVSNPAHCSCHIARRS